MKNKLLGIIMISTFFMSANVLAGTSTYKMGAKHSDFSWTYSSAVYSLGDGDYLCYAIPCSNTLGSWGKLRADGVRPYDSWGADVAVSPDWTWWNHIDSLSNDVDGDYTYYKAWETWGMVNLNICDTDFSDGHAGSYMKIWYQYEDGGPIYTRFLHAG